VTPPAVIAFILLPVIIAFASPPAIINPLFARLFTAPFFLPFSLSLTQATAAQVLNIGLRRKI